MASSGARPPHTQLGMSRTIASPSRWIVVRTSASSMVTKRPSSTTILPSTMTCVAKQPEPSSTSERMGSWTAPTLIWRRSNTATSALLPGARRPRSGRLSAYAALTVAASNTSRGSPERKSRSATRLINMASRISPTMSAGGRSVPMVTLTPASMNRRRDSRWAPMWRYLSGECETVAPCSPRRLMSDPGAPTQLCSDMNTLCPSSVCGPSSPIRASSSIGVTPCRSRTRPSSTRLMAAWMVTGRPSSLARCAVRRSRSSLQVSGCPGHSVFMSEHSWVGAPGSDINLLGEHGATFSHSPLKYLHMGAHLESLRRFIDAGVNVTMGTDLPPADMVGEMRLAMLMSRVADRDFLSGDPRDVFDAATVNAAYALNRSDLGRLAPGSKADVAVFDLRQMSVGAVHDPIRSLVEDGSGCFATHVMVDGKMVVEDGRFITIDEAEILATVQRDGEAMVRDIPNWVWGGRAPQEAIPPSYPPHSSP